MLTINKLLPGGSGLAPVLLKRAASVELDWDIRQKSRFDASDSQGRTLAVFLPRGTVLRGGDVLVAEDGSLIRVVAAAQKVLVVRHCPQHGLPSDLARAAYHLGNRHVAVELKPDHLKLEPDHVLAAMLQRMHLIVSQENSAFEPEGGAYQAGHGVHGPHQDDLERREHRGHHDHHDEADHRPPHDQGHAQQGHRHAQHDHHTGHDDGHTGPAGHGH